MTLTRKVPPRSRVVEGTRRFGYVVAVLVNIVLLFVVNNLLAWGVPGFLTEDFNTVLPIVNVSLVASAIVNVVYLVNDDRWFKSLSQAGLAAISLVVAIRTLTVFPFDFARYDFDWALVTRTILVFVIVALSIAIVAEALRGISASIRKLSEPPSR